MGFVHSQVNQIIVAVVQVAVKTDQVVEHQLDPVVREVTEEEVVATVAELEVVEEVEIKEDQEVMEVVEALHLQEAEQVEIKEDQEVMEVEIVMADQTEDNLKLDLM